MHIQMWLCLFCTVWTDLSLALVIAALIHSYFRASVYECRLFAIMWPAGDRLHPFHKVHEWACMCAFMKIQAYMIYMLCGYFCINVFLFFLLCQKRCVTHELSSSGLEYLFHQHVLINESAMFVWGWKGFAHIRACADQTSAAHSFHSSSLFKHEGSTVLFVFL